MRNLKSILLVFFGLTSANMLFANNALIPTGNNSFYYEIGGGSDFTLPPNLDSTTIKLTSDASLSLASSCSFDPSITINSYINGEAKDLENQIFSSATAALIYFPSYILSKKDPSLYNLLSNNTLGGTNQFNLKSKDCLDMKRDIEKGNNPYQDFATISVNNDFQKKLSLQSSSKSQDVVSVMNDVNENNGDNGIPWVQGSNSGGTKMAGGSGQPVIHVIHDTSIAGYNTILGRDVSDLSAPSNKDSNYIAKLWATPEDAATWIVQTVGDMNVQTCDDKNCEKSQTPGHGLRYWVDGNNKNSDNYQYSAQKIQEEIQGLVTGDDDITRENLLKVSAPGVIINESVINALKQIDPTTQAILINKLGEEVSAQKVFDMAITARRILQTGSEVPVILSNKPAEIVIHESMKKLDDDIQSMMFEHNARAQMMSNTVTAILNYSQAQNRESVTNPTVDTNPAPVMHGGAIMTNGEG